MSGDGINSSAGPRIILLVVVILPVANVLSPVPQLRIMFPPVETTLVTDKSTGPGKFSNRESLTLRTSEFCALIG